MANSLQEMIEPRRLTMGEAVRLALIGDAGAESLAIRVWFLGSMLADCGAWWICEGWGRQRPHLLGDDPK
jgi:hypothetical protein